MEEFFSFEVITQDDVLRAIFFSRCRQSENGCWLWTGTTTAGGYGHLGFRRKKWLAHHLSHYLFKGAVPAGMHVLHSCDTPRCVNPAHLRAGTPKENVADCIARGRLNRPKGSRNTLAKLTEADVIDMRNSNLGPTALAEKYGIDRTNVHLILTGKTWRHVSERAQENVDGN